MRYTLASKLVNELVEAAEDKQLTKLINHYGRVDLILVDDLLSQEFLCSGRSTACRRLDQQADSSAIATSS
ncbi:bacterial dnaA family protein [Mycobacterium kansasii 824]|nr:bacterial dnaA family protein [Mycobacterium kansasii 824]